MCFIIALLQSSALSRPNQACSLDVSPDGPSFEYLVRLAISRVFSSSKASFWTTLKYGAVGEFGFYGADPMMVFLIIGQSKNFIIGLTFVKLWPLLYSNTRLQWASISDTSIFPHLGFVSGLILEIRSRSMSNVLGSKIEFIRA